MTEGDGGNCQGMSEHRRSCAPRRHSEYGVCPERSEEENLLLNNRML